MFLWAFAIVYWRRRGEHPIHGGDGFSPARGAIGGLIAQFAYLLILAAFAVAPLTAVAPLRESAVVLASGWGAFRLGEAADRSDAWRRIAAATLIVVGAILLAID